MPSGHRAANSGILAPKSPRIGCFPLKGTAPGFSCAVLHDPSRWVRAWCTMYPCPLSSHRAWLLCFAPDTFVPIRSSQLSPQPESTALRGYETTCMPEWRTFPLARPPNDDANDGATVRACTNRLTQGSPPDLPGSPIVDSRRSSDWARAEPPWIRRRTPTGWAYGGSERILADTWSRRELRSTGQDLPTEDAIEDQYQRDCGQEIIMVMHGPDGRHRHLDPARCPCFSHERQSLVCGTFSRVHMSHLGAMQNCQHMRNFICRKKQKSKEK